MKIEIHIRDTDTHGKRVGLRNAFVESCRVYKEAGDGLRLDRLAIPAYAFFKSKSDEFMKIVKGTHK